MGHPAIKARYYAFKVNFITARKFNVDEK